MISTQRLIAIFVIFNLFVGIISGFQENYDINVTETNIRGINTWYDNKTTEVTEHDIYSGIKNTNIQQEFTVGNSVTFTGVLWDMATNGLNIFSVNPGKYHAIWAKLLATAIMIFRTLMTIFLALEIYMLFKNKKVS